MRFAFLLLLFAPPVRAAEVTVTLGDLKAGAVIDQTHLKKLSQNIQLTVWVEGPGPLEVTPPKPLLTRPNSWRTFDVGLPLREVLPNGRQRWQQAYRLSPLDVRERTPIPLAPFVVRAGNQKEQTIDWTDTVHYVNVESSVKNVTVDALHEPADIEQLPPPPPKQTASFSWWFSIIPICLLLALLLILFARRKTTLLIHHDAEWALHELTNATTPDRCASVLREYVGFRHGLDPRSSTTAELISRVQPESRLTGEQIGELQALLDTCDQMRFSGTENTLHGLGAQARGWIEHAEEVFRTSSTNLGVKVG